MFKHLPAAVLLILTLGFAQVASAQVHIVENDTALCVPQPLTLHATVDSGQTATGLVIADDTYSELIPLDFPFTFYGNTYNDMYLSTNAYIKFGGDGGGSPWVITSTDSFPTGSQSAGGGEMTNVIMGPWHDTDPGVNNPDFVNAMDYKTVGTAPNRIFVFSFCEVPMFSCNDINFSGQILLFETTNVIEVHLNHKVVCPNWNTGQAVLGLQDISGAYATIVPGHNVGTQWTSENEAWRFVATSDTSYSWQTIPYGPIPIYSGGGVKWYDNGTLLGAGLSIDTDLSPGLHEIIAEVNGCYVASAFDTIYVTVGAPAIQSHTNVPCVQATTGTATVEFSGNAPFFTVWTDTAGNVLEQDTVIGTGTVTGLSAGDYFLQITDTSGCVSTLDYTIDIVPNAAIVDVSQQNVPCAAATNGFAAVELSNAPYTVVWTNFEDSVLQQGQETVTDTLFNLGAGNYNVTVTDEFGCISEGTFTIAIEPQPLNPVATHPNVECPESNAGFISIQLSNDDPYQSIWVNLADTSDILLNHTFSGTDMLDDITAGAYGVLLTDAVGCTFAFQYTVGANTFDVDFTMDQDTICAGDEVNFTPITNEVVTLYSWNYGDGNVGNQIAPVHQFANAGNPNIVLTITNSDYGCTDTASHPLFIRPNIIAGFGSTEPACVGTPVYFTDASTANPANWSWDFGGLGTSTEENPQFVFNNPGTYPVTLNVIDSHCGTDSYDTTVTVNAFPSLNLEPDTSTICKGQTVFFDAGNSGDTYLWYNGDQTQTISPIFQVSTWVSVTVDHLGCTETDSAYVDVACDLQMPNAFTPNGDLNNDLFRPVGHNILYYDLHIFDRWGHEIYSATHALSTGNDGWNGKINGKEAEIGSYSYFVKGVLLTNLVVEEAGNVILIR